MKILFEAMSKGMEMGMYGTYSREPEEAVEMPENTIEGIYDICSRGEVEFSKIVAQLNPDKNGKPRVLGRIKSLESIERKLADTGMEPKQLDDINGKMLVVDSVEDMEKLVKLLYDDPRVFRIFDYYTAPAEKTGGYYAIHANYKLSNGAVCELQIITKRLCAWKETWGHIIYEVFRECAPVADRTGDKRIIALVNKIRNYMVEGYLECRKCDEEHSRIYRPDWDFTPEEFDLIEQIVSEHTFMRCMSLNNKRDHSLDKPITSHHGVDLTEAKILLFNKILNS